MGDDQQPAAPPADDESRRRAEALVGTIISQRYRIEALIAAGGMGAVYRGEHVLMRKRIAIKVLLQGAANLPQLIERFRREAIVGAHVSHPNIASATDFGQLDDGSHFLVMEHINGRTLAELLKAEGPLAPERAAGIARQVALGLHAAHSAGVVHRDIKPQNVMLVEPDANRSSVPALLLGRDVVKVIDFGFANMIEERLSMTPSTRHSIAPGRITQQGEVFGTIAYLAPEAAEGMDAVDARSDLYALGIVMYQMLTGQHPFTESEPAALFRAHLRQIPPSFSVRAPRVEVPPELEAVVMRLLRKDPAARFQTGLELVAAIEEATGASGVVSMGGFQLVPSSLPPDLLAAATPEPPAASVRGRELPPVSIRGREPPAGAIRGHEPPEAPGGDPEAPAASARGVDLPPPTARVPGEAPSSAALGPAALPASPSASDTSAPGASLSAPAAGPRPSRAWLGGVVAGVLVACAAGALAVGQGLLFLRPSAAPGAPPEPSAAPVEPSAEPPEPPASAPAAAPAASAASPRELATWKRKMKMAAQARNWTAAKAAFFKLAELSPASLSEPQILPGVTDLVANLARSPGAEADEVFELLEKKTGSAGLDVLYELVQMRGGTLAAEQATEILKNPEVLARATPAVRVAFELRVVPCDKKAELFERAAAEGDLRMFKAFDLVRSSCGSSLALEQSRASLRARLRGAPRR